MVYDIGSAQTFRNLPEWLQEVERYAGKDVHRILIGNKSDRQDREITAEVGKRFAQENEMPFLETSAKTSDNIDILFMQLATSLRDTHQDKKLKPHYGGSSAKQPNTVSLTQQKQNDQGGGGGGCC